MNWQSTQLDRLGLHLGMLFFFSFFFWEGGRGGGGGNLAQNSRPIYCLKWDWAMVVKDEPGFRGPGKARRLQGYKVSALNHIKGAKARASMILFLLIEACCKTHW